jgi:hypothetical protein
MSSKDSQPSYAMYTRTQASSLNWHQGRLRNVCDGEMHEMGNSSSAEMASILNQNEQTAIADCWDRLTHLPDYVGVLRLHRNTEGSSDSNKDRRRKENLQNADWLELGVQLRRSQANGLIYPNSDGDEVLPGFGLHTRSSAMTITAGPVPKAP